MYEESPRPTLCALFRNRTKNPNLTSRPLVVGCGSVPAGATFSDRLAYGDLVEGLFLDRDYILFGPLGSRLVFPFPLEDRFRLHGIFLGTGREDDFLDSLR